MKFWDWFSQHEHKYYKIEHLGEEQKEILLDELIAQLHAYCDKLFFELSGEGELIITAGGDKTLFSTVDELVNNAPVFERWKVIALKPPVGEHFQIDYNGIAFNSEEIFFYPLESTKSPLLGVRLFVKGYNQEFIKDYHFGGWIILDTILGERSTAIDIGHLDIADLPEDPEADSDQYPGGLMPVMDLNRYVKWRNEKRNNA
jgi:hypothetical protein